VTALVLVAAQLSAEPPPIRVRTPMRIPDIPGYVTVKADLHIHTVFSDGSVWPDVRPEEAWREGLDAIAMTDHIEYLPHAEDLPPNHNRSYQIAAPLGERLDVIVIAGSEVTRDMPPGHLNAIFISDADALDQPDWRDALAAAGEQRAFVFWNHPGWSGQQPDGRTRWYDEHQELVEAGLLHGIEVVNTREYYPEAHRLCLEKKLTLLSNSDVHAPSNLDYHVHAGDHRPLTLVFATERSSAGIREALFDRRTAVYSGEMLVGEERFLRPLFDASVELLTPELPLSGEDDPALVQLRNHSDVTFSLRRLEQVPGLTLPERLVLAGDRTSLLEVEAEVPLAGPRDVEVRFEAENVKLTPEQNLVVSLRFRLVAE
jgi:hypothetical protein